MNLVLEIASWLFIGVGIGFFISGSIGLVRFPDIFCRLHAVTKADTLGLGLVALGMACRAESVASALLMVFIWLLVMASSAVACQLLARYSLPATDAEGPDQVPRHDRDGHA